MLVPCTLFSAMFHEDNSILEVLLGINQRLTILKINITWSITDSQIKEYYFIHYITN